MSIVQVAMWGWTVVSTVSSATQVSLFSAKVSQGSGLIVSGSLE